MFAAATSSSDRSARNAPIAIESADAIAPATRAVRTKLEPPVAPEKPVTIPNTAARPPFAPEIQPGARLVPCLAAEDAVEPRLRGHRRRGWRAQAGAELAQRADFDAEARATAAIDTWRGVNDVAREIGAAAIVIGSRGLTGLRAVLEGSVSRQVEAHAHRLVLVVPSAA